MGPNNSDSLQLRRRGAKGKQKQEARQKKKQVRKKALKKRGKKEAAKEKSRRRRIGETGMTKESKRGRSRQPSKTGEERGTVRRRRQAEGGEAGAAADRAKRSAAAVAVKNGPANGRRRRKKEKERRRVTADLERLSSRKGERKAKCKKGRWENDCLGIRGS